MSGQLQEIGSVCCGPYRSTRLSVAVAPVMTAGSWRYEVRLTATLERWKPRPGVRWVDHLSPAAVGILVTLLGEAREVAAQLPVPDGPAGTYPDLVVPNADEVRVDERNVIAVALREVLADTADRALVPGLVAALDVVLGGEGL